LTLALQRAELSAATGDGIRGTTLNREEAFDKAIKLIADLPCQREVIDFWDMPEVRADSDRAKWRAAADRLTEIGQKVAPDLAEYFEIWASDAAVGAEDLERGLALMPPPGLGGRASLRASNILDLKLSLGGLPAARDITALFGPKVTKFGRENLGSVEQFIQLQLDARAAHGDPVDIARWTQDAHQHKAGYSLFNGHPSYLVVQPPGGWHFSYSKCAEAECVALVRDAENTWREESDLPRVGEGWISETRLYYELKAAFPAIEVLQHHRPEWLGRQHLDIAIPSLRTAIEFQGAQHDLPVAFFGGEDAFIRTQERDRRKLGKCRKQGWRLFYAREGYDLTDLIAQIAAPR
jgi:hypothetical protein